MYEWCIFVYLYRVFSNWKSWNHLELWITVDMFNPFMHNARTFSLSKKGILKETKDINWLKIFRFSFNT